jgi:hypothetical protein
MARRGLLVCGILSSAVYLSADVFGSLRWDGYNYTDQTISELAAIGSPSRPLVMWLFTAYNLLLIAFASGVVLSAADRPALRRSANAIGVIGWIGVVAAFFPIHVRGAAWTINETMHSVLTGITVLVIIGAMIFAAQAGGRRFRHYSIVTIVVMSAFGAWSGWIGRGLAAELPTPWIGLTERICIFSYLAWITAFAATLLRRHDRLAGLTHLVDAHA